MGDLEKWIWSKSSFHGNQQQCRVLGVCSAKEPSDDDDAQILLSHRSFLRAETVWHFSCHRHPSAFECRFSPVCHVQCGFPQKWLYMLVVHASCSAEGWLNTLRSLAEMQFGCLSLPGSQLVNQHRYQLNKNSFHTGFKAPLLEERDNGVLKSQVILASNTLQKMDLRKIWHSFQTPR